MEIFPCGTEGRKGVKQTEREISICVQIYFLQFHVNCELAKSELLIAHPLHVDLFRFMDTSHTATSHEDELLIVS